MQEQGQEQKHSGKVRFSLSDAAPSFTCTLTPTSAGTAATIRPRLARPEKVASPVRVRAEPPSRPQSAPLRRPSGKETSLRFKPGRCCGDFCNAQIRYPGSMQDIETQDDPWMRTARQLCVRKSAMGSYLLDPKELVACVRLQTASKAESKATRTPKGIRKRAENLSVPRNAFKPFGHICVSLIQEARRYPRLCSWLQAETGWMLDPWDAKLLEVAAHTISEDEASNIPFPKPPRGRRDPPPDPEPGFDGTPGLWMRLQTADVCQACLRSYTILHGVITMILGQRRDNWAKQELLRRRTEDEQRSNRRHTDLLHTLAFRTNTVSMSPRTRAAHCAKLVRTSGTRSVKRSLFLDDSMSTWLWGQVDAMAAEQAGRPKSADSRGRQKRTSILSTGWDSASSLRDS